MFQCAKKLMKNKLRNALFVLHLLIYFSKVLLIEFKELKKNKFKRLSEKYPQ